MLYIFSPVYLTIGCFDFSTVRHRTLKSAQIVLEVSTCQWPWPHDLHYILGTYFTNPACCQNAEVWCRVAVPWPYTDMDTHIQMGSTHAKNSLEWGGRGVGGLDSIPGTGITVESDRRPPKLQVICVQFALLCWFSWYWSIHSSRAGTSISHCHVWPLCIIRGTTAQYRRAGRCRHSMTT